MSKLIFIALFFCATAYASESGFIRDGKTYTVFKDGGKVGKTAEELGFVANEKSPNRKAASFTDSSGNLGAIVYFETDSLGNICYWPSWTSSAFSCIHK